MSRINHIIFPALAFLLTGCALGAVRPPTPAAHLNIDPHEPSPPGEHYYVLIWASQTIPKTPPTCHTFATVVHTVEPEPGQVLVLETHTISWLPASLDIKTMARSPEPGVNLTLKETLEYAQKNRERISLWGPYECRASFYKRFLVQKEFLETSGIGYQCIDNVGEAARIGNGCNCIHSITDSDPEFGRGNYPLIWYGDSASEHLAQRLRERGSLLTPDIQNEQVLSALCLNDFRIRRRYFGDRLLDSPRLQPAETLPGRLGRETRDAPPYATPPFPPPGNHGQ